MESTFSFLSSYFSIIFLAKGKINKFVSQSYRAKTVLANQIWNSLLFYMLIPEIKSW